MLPLRYAHVVCGWLNVDMPFLFLFIYIYIHTCQILICVRACLSACACVCASMWFCRYVCFIYVYIYVYTCRHSGSPPPLEYTGTLKLIYICIRIYTYTNIHACMHTNIQPVEFTTAPAIAIPQALKHAGLSQKVRICLIGRIHYVVHTSMHCMVCMSIHIYIYMYMYHSIRNTGLRS